MISKTYFFSMISLTHPYRDRGRLKELGAQLCVRGSPSSPSYPPFPRPPVSLALSQESFHLYCLWFQLPSTASVRAYHPHSARTPPQSQHRILFLTHANSAGRTSHLNADLVSPLNTTNKPFPSAAKCQTYQSHPTGGLCHQHTRKPCFHCYSFFWFTRDEMHWVNTPSGRKMDTSLYLHDLFEELPTVQCHVLIGGGQSSPQCKEAWLRFKCDIL